MTRKPTAEDWEKAWARLKLRIVHNCPVATYELILKMMIDEDPREPLAPTLAPEEPEMMTLSEIVALAEPGDYIKNECISSGCWKMGKDGYFHPSHDLTEVMWVSKAMMKVKWYFTKRVKRCPTCGRRVEDE